MDSARGHAASSRAAVQSMAAACACGASSAAESSLRMNEATRGASRLVRCLHRCSRQSRPVARSCASSRTSGSERSEAVTGWRDPSPSTDLSRVADQSLTGDAHGDEALALQQKPGACR
eukprot:1033003-Pleurochrysis_carterae.AAC.1